MVFFRQVWLISNRPTGHRRGLRAGRQEAETRSAATVLREKRRTLGFDYGKFDFVDHGGESALLDANRTPGAPGPELGPAVTRAFARGLHARVSGGR